jgi:hypothetical protein
MQMPTICGPSPLRNRKRVVVVDPTEFTKLLNQKT